MLTTLTLLIPKHITTYFKQKIVNDAGQKSGQGMKRTTELQHLKNQLKNIFFPMIGLPASVIASAEVTDPRPLGSVAAAEVCSSDTSTNQISLDTGILDALEKSTTIAEHYPHLKQILTIIFALNDNDDKQLALEELEKASEPDWTASNASIKFKELNERFGYFHDLGKTQKLQDIFTELAMACRTIAVLEEQNNTADDTMAYDYAYKLMALFIDESKNTPTFEQISKATNTLLTPTDRKLTQGDKPFHDVLLVKLQLPLASDVRDREGWRALIKKLREKALPFFAMAKKIEEQTSNNLAPTSLTNAKAAAVLCKYTRASEDRAFAELCYDYESEGASNESLEATFNAALDYIGSPPVWPKKTTDSLPDLIIQGTKDDGTPNDFYWVKLPPSDKRSLILGKITDCCQSIGDHSDQCVKDATSLSDNGLYVLLKHKRGDASKPKNADGSINYANFQIVGQSYVWKKNVF